MAAPAPPPAPSELGYPRALVAVDLVVLTVIDADLKLLLIQRGLPPFEGRWALPGGFVRVGPDGRDQGEDLDEAAARELEEETGLPRASMYLEQLGAFGRAGRDPRARVISIAYYALVRPTLAAVVKAGGDAALAGWRSLAELDATELAFDHGAILEACLRRVRAEIDGSSLAFQLVPETFTIPELRAVHEVVQGTTYDPGNFRRRVKRMLTDGILEEAPGRRITSAKPARVYRFSGRPGRYS